MRTFFIVVLVVLALVGVATAVGGHATDRYVPETGHTIDARFVAFYDEHGGQHIHGYPITDSFVDPKTGLMVQYFENTRLELIPTENSGWEIQLAPLGQMIYGWDATQEGLPIAAEPGCRFFPDSRFSVCHSFLEFYERNKGSKVFGLPISGTFVQDGKLVQTFQRVQLYWDPASSRGEELQIAPLGQMHFELMGYNRELLFAPAPSEVPVFQAVEINMDVSVASPLVESGAIQYVFITVRDENQIPIEGAATLLTAHLPQGTKFILLPATDADGVTMAQLELNDQPSGNEVLLEVLVMYGDLYAVGRDSFLIQ